MKYRFLFLLLFTLSSLEAQPSPGDLYKEYTWYNEVDDCGGALRVGGKLDYRVTGNAIPYFGDGRIKPVFHVDLNHAVRAELVIEKMLCHGGTEGLRVAVNGHDPIHVPEAEHILSPQSAYAHHFNQVVPLDLSFLKGGKDNTFVFEVDTAGHWWPQNLLYGMILHIYYEPWVLEQRGKIVSPQNGSILGESNLIQLDLPVPSGVKKVDLVGFYDDADLEGDGIYRQWHYGYHQCQIYNHIGTASEPPFEITWDTEWLPDQAETMKLSAMVHLDNGYIYMTESVDELVLSRPGISVELCKPYRRPKGWFTRNGEFSERFQIKGNLEQAAEASMVFRTWSPGYFNGITINNFLVFIKEGPKYAYYQHDIPITDLHVLKQGENVLKTGKTPRYHGQMVHGVEVQWPGIMLLIKYDLAIDPGASNSH
jgi:hypothetical protein